MDRSKQGYIDEDIAGLVSLINSLDEYKTTSSCSGRIVLIKNAGEKLKAEWLYKTHAKADFKKIFDIQQRQKVWFLLEPVILHLKCSNLKSAQKMLTTARNSGFKISGITSVKNCTLELRGTERMETILDKNDKRYVKLLVGEANKKLKRTKEKIRRLYLALPK